MPRDTRNITRDDIMPLDQYETIRPEKRQDNVLRKKFRRMSIGPHATIIFENWDSMWWQVHEMLRIEKGGEEQIADELAAYNPMVPDGSELTATLLFEVDDPIRRTAFLKQLGGVEDHIFIDVAGIRVGASPEGDVERTRDDGKASAVQFLHFRFSAEAIARFKRGGGRVTVGIDHPAYGHLAVIGTEARYELGRDFA
jgi:hypothetical protein